MPQMTRELRSYRLRAKLSQSKLARVSDLDRTTVSNAENGKEVSELTMYKLAEALSNSLGGDVSVDEIISKSIEN